MCQELVMYLTVGRAASSVWNIGRVREFTNEARSTKGKSVSANPQGESPKERKKRQEAKEHQEL